MPNTNAPGEPPSRDDAIRFARASLSFEEGSNESLPPFYLPILTKFLTENPGDTNFLVEFGEGDNFGTVTCIEDQCWNDVVLSADPDIPDGGRAQGLGSFYEYAVHCRGEEHIRWRDKRLAKAGIVIPPRTTPAPAVMPRDIAHASTSAANSSPTPGPSSAHASSLFAGRQNNALAGSASLPPALYGQNIDRGHSLQRNHSSPLASRNLNLPGRASGSGEADKWSNALHVLSDSDDDDVTYVGTSQSSSSVLAPHMPSSQADQNTTYYNKWASLGLSERRNVATYEIEQINAQLARKPEFNLMRALMRRKLNLESLRMSAMRPWMPPEDMLLQALPDSAYHPHMRDTFQRPDRKPVIPTAPGADPWRPWSQPMASTSTAPHVPGAFPVVPATTMTSNLAWKAIPSTERLPYLLKEIKMLDWAATTLQGDRSLFGLEFQGRAHNLRNSVLTGEDDWSPPTPKMLQVYPKLREAIHPDMVQFLPGVAGALRAEGRESFDDEYGVEYNRPQGKDLQTFLQDSLQDFQEDVDVEAGLKVLNLANINEKIPGANFQLMPHQVLGVAFMTKREDRTDGSRGGFLLDAMGLGKTVQCISLMLLRDVRPTDYEKSPQLVVAPLALLAQWKSEIETKTTKGWRILIHHGSGRPKTATALKQYDIVLTTYGTLVSESGLTTKNERRKKRHALDEGDDYDDAPARQLGPLLKIQWYRVILDEGHLVRNKGTRTSKAALKLDCLHPWILTGTPIVNSLADLGPGISFIGQMDLTDFHSKVSSWEKKKPKMAAKRCQVILRPLMLRRSKDTVLNGKRILDLLPKVTNLASLPFEQEERAIYAALEQRARIRVNKFIQRGTLMKNYSIVLQLLTRLRQCVNHPWLLRRKPGDFARDDDLVVEDDGMLGADMSDYRVDDASEYGRAIGVVGAGGVEIMVKKLKERHESMMDENSEPQDMECAICYEPFDGSEIITPCAHIYCKVCLSSLFTEPMRNENALSEDEIQRGCRSCPMCREVIWPGRVFRAAAIYRPPQDEKPEADEAEDADDDTKPTKDRKGKKRASDADDLETQAKRAAKGKGRASSEEVADLEEPSILPSTKMRHLLELVQGYLQEDPNVKILVFSQFVEFLDLLRDFLRLNNIESIGYRGAMSQSQRDEAIRRFNMSSSIADNVPVMLISTKAGGVGLNLVMASKVIMCELAWNPATENQAVDRAHRIGQTKQVNVERLVIEDSVEDRLLEIQERKGLLADGAMGEGDIGKLGRLTVDDIRNLFAIGREYDRDDD